MAQLVEHADGIYIGLHPDAYRADWALGYSAIKTLAYSPYEWWWESPFNLIDPPKPEAKDPRHLMLGTASHVALLEGMDVYKEAYGILPTTDDHPEALVTVKDIQAVLRQLHLPTSGDKPDLIARLLAAEPSIEILEVLQAEWRMQNAGLRQIDGAADRRIRLLQHIAMMSPDEFTVGHGEVVTLHEAFTGGLSELSVFWTDEHGVRHRCRFDKIKPNVSIDLKTFSSWERGRNFDSALLREIKQRKYWLQVAHYQAGREALRRLVLEGKIHGGTEAQRALLFEIADSDSWGWVWIFAVTEGYPHVKGVLADLEGISFGKASQDREDAIAQFITNRDTWGLDRMWLDPVRLLEPTEDDWAMA